MVPRLHFRKSKNLVIVNTFVCKKSRPGELLADVLEAALLLCPGQSECQSTEDMLSKIDLANDVIREKGVDICVGSGDATALYPSLLHDDSARHCGNLIRNCPAKFENIDVKSAAIFIATNCTLREIRCAELDRIVPARKHKRGKRPTAATKELTSHRGDREGEVPLESKFHPVRENLTQSEIKTLLAKVVEVGVKMVIQSHVYKWKGEHWLQNLGVPTGLRLSGVVGRITMDVWRGEMFRLMEENSMTNYLLEKYVDDGEVLCENIPMGSRWDGSKMVVTDEAAEDDRITQRSREEVTMRAWGDMASSVIPGLKFTVDFPSNHDDNAVPMLDFKLWKEREEDPNYPGVFRESVRYSFFYL